MQNARALLRHANFNAAAAERLVISWRELSRAQKKGMAAKNLPSLLIISPEACSDIDLIKLLSKAMIEDKLAMLVIDEVHTTVTDMNFRPVMRDVLLFSQRFSEVRQLYLSGTLTGESERRFRLMRKQMEIITFRGNVERSDLSLKITKHENDDATLQNVCNQVQAYRQANPDELVLVYAPTKKLVHLARERLVVHLRIPSNLVGVFTGDLETSEKISLGARVRRGDVKVLVGTDGVGVGLDLPIKTLWMLHGAHGLYEFAQIAQRAGRCASLGHATVQLHMVRDGKQTLAESIERLKVFRTDRKSVV
jgi:superfamily II DNA helicase RecQ